MIHYLPTLWLRCAAFFGALAILPAAAFAQTVTASLMVGASPKSIAVNPATSTIYVANSGSNSVTVVNGLTNSTATVTVGSMPVSIAVNPVTNLIYVANSGSANVTVINGISNDTSTVIVGTNPTSVAVNPATNEIYVANQGSGNVTVIDGATNSTTTVTVGTSPVSLAVNPVTNEIYVANSGSASVTVINGASNSTTTIGARTKPQSVAVDPVTNMIYVANYGSANVTVINGATSGTTTVAAGSSPKSVVVNPVTNTIYVANYGTDTVTVINGATNSTTTVTVGTTPISVAVNATTNEIYVANEGSANVTVINGATNSTVPLTAGSNPYAIAVNPVTDKIYVANNASGTVTLIDGATNNISTVPLGVVAPYSVAVNPMTNKIYVASVVSNTTGNVTVIDGTTNNTTTVPVGAYPISVAVNPVTNQIYVVNHWSNNVTVIDGATNDTTTVAAGDSPYSAAVNPVTNKIYVANATSTNVTVIDGVTNSTTTVAVGTAGYYPGSVALNPVTNKIYVANTDGNNMTVVDGVTNSSTTVALGQYPYSVAVNPVTNKIYVTSATGPVVSVIDGATNSTTFVTAGAAPYALAVNPVTNKIYVTNNSSNNVTVIDGATNSTTTVAAGTSPQFVTVNPVTNKIYIANVAPYPNPGTITVIDGATNTTTTLTAGSDPYWMAMNPVTNKIYIANTDGGNVTVIDEQQVQPVPLTTSITPLTNNRTSSTTPSFTFGAESEVTVPDGLFFRVDSWQNAWTAAAGSNPSYTGTVASLQPGFHILYAYAVDGQEATSTQAGAPLTGTIQSYGFLVEGPPTVVSLSPSSGAGLTQTFTAGYSDPNGAADLESVRLLFNTSPIAANACYVYYFPASNLLYLENDGGTGLTTGIAPGSSATISNSQCTLAGTGSSYTVSGDIAMLTAALTFNGTFTTGSENAYLFSQNISDVTSGWVQKGTWGPPAVVSLSPSSGTGLTQAFTAIYSDPNGAVDLATVRLLFNTAAVAGHGCYVYYYPGANLLYLENDGANGFTSGIAPGSSGSVSNSQCTLAGAGSSYGTSGDNATLTVALTFSNSFEGQKNVYLLAQEINGVTSGSVEKGTWTIPSVGPPTVVSLSPGSGSGLTQAFTAVFSDPNGIADLSAVHILFNTVVTAANGCYVFYYPASNMLYLENDAGTGLIAGIAPGSSGSVSNSQCTLAGTGSSYSVSGNNGTLTAAITFSGTFTGSKNVYLLSQDIGGASSGWVEKGTWTP